MRPSHRKVLASVVALGLLSALVAGCDAPDPERNCDEDCTIHRAGRIHIDRVTRGQVSYNDGLRTTWKTFTLPTDSDLQITLDSKLPSEDANMTVNLFGPHLNNLGEVDANPDAPVTMPFPNLAAGKYYLVIYAPKQNDGGEYKLSFQVTPHQAPAGDDGTPPPPLLAAVPTQAAPPPTASAPAAVAAPPPAAQIGGHIVEVQRSGGYTILVLDVGTDAGIKAGSRGTIVDQTNAPIPGADFVVNPRRLGPHSCIATTRVEPSSITSTNVEIAP